MKGQPGKAPAFQFYAKDWLCDLELRLTSASTRGIWIDLLCHMWHRGGKGEITLGEKEIMQLTGATAEEVKIFIAEAQAHPFCRVILLHNGKITLHNRRMKREFETRQKLRESNRLRQKKWREKQERNKASHQPNGGSPSPSPIPYPSPNTKQLQKQPAFFDFDAEKIASFSPDEIEIELSDVTVYLIQMEKFKNVKNYISRYSDEGKNKKAILHSLIMTAKKAEFKYSAWSYAKQIMESENGAYNARDAEAESKKYKDGMEVASAFVCKLTSSIGKPMDDLTPDQRQELLNKQAAKLRAKENG